MKFRRPRSSIAPKMALAVTVAVVVAGCGEVKNTINPTAPPNTVTVALGGAPNAFYVGIYDAQALGYFKQSDLNVRLVIPTSTQDPVTMVHDGQVLVGVSSEVSVLLHRNEEQPVVGVAALVHGPLPAITITEPAAGSSGGAAPTTTTAATTTTTAKSTKTTKPATTTTTPSSTTPTSTATTPTTTTVAEPDTTLWPAALQTLLSKPGYPTYDGLVLVVRKGSIVQHAPLLRRFVQAVARGYRAARANPTQAITNLITAVPSLAPQKPLQLATLNAAIPSFFPAGLKVWGWQRQAQWNSFGTWLMQNHLLSNPNAISDASTNELLPGQGV